jgi:hypothetical protein
MSSRGRTFDELLAWAINLASLEPMELALYEIEDCAVFLENWAEACTEAPRVVDALGAAADKFVKVAQYALCEVVWREDLPLTLCEQAISGSLAMLTALCERTGQTLVGGMFWMVVLERWDVILRRKADHRLLPTVKSTLLEQVRLAREVPCLRDGAREGIRLIDEEIAIMARRIDEGLE